jgi:colanic acid/amylovoran biosynthesis glycosyltransferase
LKVIGEGPMEAEMKAVLAEAGVGHRVDFLGSLEPKEAAAEMARAHIFCLPSCIGPDGDSEGVPTVLKEALASGIPVVSTHHAGIPELIEDGVHGYLVRERDHLSLADRLLQLLSEPDRWEAMGRAGRARVEAEFSVASAVRQLDAEVYGPLLGGAAPSATAGSPCTSAVKPSA